MTGSFCLSVVLHLFVLLLLVSFFEQQTALQPVVVDLSMEVGNLAAARSPANSKVDEATQKQPAAKRLPQKTIPMVSRQLGVPASKAVAAPVTLPDFSATPAKNADYIHNNEMQADSNSTTVAAKDQAAVSGAFATGSATATGKNQQQTSGNGQGAAGQAQQRYLQENFSHVRDKIMENLHYPPLARRMNWSGKVLLSFRIGLDGNISNLKIKESAGREVLDHSALETVRKSAPFPKPPFPVEIVVPVNFRLI